MKVEKIVGLFCGSGQEKEDYGATLTKKMKSLLQKGKKNGLKIANNAIIEANDLKELQHCTENEIAVVTKQLAQWELRSGNSGNTATATTSPNHDDNDASYKRDVHNYRMTTRSIVKLRREEGQSLCMVTVEKTLEETLENMDIGHN